VSLLSKLLRFLCWLALGIYFVAGFAWLGVRYWLIPNIDTWRPVIVEQISTRLGVRLDVAHMALDWSHPDPVFVLNGVELRDASDERVLHLPRVAGRLSWRGLSRGKLWFQELELERLELALHRDENQRLRMLTQTFDISDTDTAASSADALEEDTLSLNHPAIRWLSQQKHVVLRDAALTWTDATRSKDTLKPLALDRVTMVWLHDQGSKDKESHAHPRWQLSLSGQPTAAIGGRFQLKGEFTLNAALAENPTLADPTLQNPFIKNPKNWDARLYISMQDVAPDAWRNWLDMPEQLDAERLSTQWWLTVQQGEMIDIAIASNLTRGRWRQPAAVVAGNPEHVQVAAAQVLVKGTWQAYREFYVQWFTAEGMKTAQAQTTQDATPIPPLDVQLTLQGTTLNLPALFEQPLQFDEVRARARLGRDEANHQPELTLAHVQVRNADMDVDFSGRWQPHEKSTTGWAALQGAFQRAKVTALAAYFPRMVNAATRQWMRDGLQSGHIRQAPFLLEGELDDFPFAEKKAAENQTTEKPRGQWRLDGRFEDVTIDYAPAGDDSKGWPKLEHMHGQLAMRNADLRMTAERAQMTPAAGYVVQLANVQAHIPNLLDQTTLNLHGQSEASADAYLALVRHTPLQTLLQNTLDETRLEGGEHWRWRVPLRLTVPLLHSRQTRVRGQVQFTPPDNDGASTQLTLFNDIPLFEQVSGTLDFSEWGVSLQDLRARFLGGDVVVSGGLGTNQPGLGIVGRASVAAIKQAFDVQHLHPLDGEFDYQFLLSRIDDGVHRGRYRYAAQSDGVGVISTLPAPLNKAADTSWPVQISWTPHGPEAGTTALNVQLADVLTAQLVRFGKTDSPAESSAVLPSLGGFHQAAIGVGTSIPALPASGLALNIQQTGTLDVSAWQENLQSMLTPAGQDEAAEEIPSTTAAQEQESPPQSFLPVPAKVNVHAGQIHVAGLRLDQASVAVDYEPAQHLLVDVDSTQATGAVAWSADRHRVDTHFSRFALDVLQADATDYVNDEAQTDKHGNAHEDLFPRELDLPDIALTVDDFSAAGYQLGQLSLHGRVAQRGRLWLLDSVQLNSPSAQVSGQGHWRLRSGKNTGDEENAHAPRGLSLQAELTSGNVGDYLREIGVGDIMQGGAGSMAAQLDWAHLPWQISMKNLSGTIKLDLQKGRLSSIRSQSAKLLELLSVQSLQRLFNSDVRSGDVFASGFPFDHWTGTLHLGQGRIQTNDYRIQGAVGSVHLAGEAVWHSGELDAQAMVVPRVDMSGASLAAGIVNPLVGVGALLTQWILRRPLSRAMTLHYAVKGNWKEPHITEVTASGEPLPSKAENAPSLLDGIPGEH